MTFRETHRADFSRMREGNAAAPAGLSRHVDGELGAAAARIDYRNRFAAVEHLRRTEKRERRFLVARENVGLRSGQRTHGSRELGAVGRAAHRARRNASHVRAVVAHGIHIIADRRERSCARGGIEPARVLQARAEPRSARLDGQGFRLAEDEQPRGVRPDRD